MIKYHTDLIQGSDAWLAARCGLLTASEMKLIVTLPKPETRIKKDGTPFKPREITFADSDVCRTHLWELLAQRITGHVEASYIGDDMLRGREDEIEARGLYAARYAPVSDMGFITNDKWGFAIGYSPDGMVGDVGLIECKSRRQKYQIETIVSCSEEDTIPADYVMQAQTGLLVSERKWLDFISYSGGLPMVTIRVYPDAKIQAAIIEASSAFEARLTEKMEKYRSVLGSDARLIPTERRVEQEMYA